jgi:hypothetical protein
MHDDRDLREIFDAQRRADLAGVPPFSRALAPRMQPRVRRTWPAFATVAAAVLLTASVALWRLTPEPEAPFVFRAGELRVPTDYLLELASYPRAGAIPPIGVVDWFPLESASDSTRRSQ